MQNAVTSRLLDLFQQSLTLMLLVWYLLSTHFRLALVCLVLVPAVILSDRAFRSRDAAYQSP